MIKGPDRTELDSLHAGLALMRQELSQAKREWAISQEEVYKRLVWYSHLERLLIVASGFLKDPSRLDELEEIVERCRLVHRFVSPAVNTPEQEQERAERADVVPWARPA